MLVPGGKLPTHSAWPDCFGVLRCPPGVVFRLELGANGEGETIPQNSNVSTEIMQAVVSSIAVIYNILLTIHYTRIWFHRSRSIHNGLRTIISRVGDLSRTSRLRSRRTPLVSLVVGIQVLGVRLRMSLLSRGRSWTVP